MIDRGRWAALALGLLGAACGHPEKGVVDQYFNAVNAKDTQTLTSFSAVAFDKKVDRWAIKKNIDEKKTPAALPELLKKAKDIEAELAANKKAAGTYSLEHYTELDQVKDLRKKSQPIPAKLAAAAAEWDRFNEKDRELKRALANAKDAAEKERRSAIRSVGQVDDLETLEGEMTEKQVEVDLTISGQTQPYVMTLRKYELKRDGGARVMSRWVVQGLQPRG